jgi:ribonuclease-3
MISLEREKLLSELEQKIGYSFRSRALLDRALTHRSFANERIEERCQHNESLEFLGDSVLGLIVSSWLLERFPDLSEGKLSKMKAYLVSESSLVDVAEVIDLGRYLLLNRGEEKTGGRRKRALLADAYEALIGVIYLDGGLKESERFLRREMREKVEEIDPSAMIGADYKSALQEQLQAAGAPVPEYIVVEALGPDHRRTFRVGLRVGGQTLATGEGRTIKLAQQEAARTAISMPNMLTSVIAEHIEDRITIDQGNQNGYSVSSTEESDNSFTDGESLTEDSENKYLINQSPDADILKPSSDAAETASVAAAFDSRDISSPTKEKEADEANIAVTGDM